MSNTDKIVMGKMRLDKFMQFMYKFLDSINSYNDITVVNTLHMCTDLYIEKAVSRPIILYVKDGILSNSNSYVGLDNYINEIVDVEQVSMLYALANLSLERQKKFSVRWSIFEIEKCVKQGIGISQMCFLEHMQSINKNSINTVGRIDYDKFEKMFFNSFDSYLLTGKSTCKSILSCILGIKASSKKNKYPIKVPKGFTYDLSYLLTEIDREYVYRVACPVCNKKHSIVLNKRDEKLYSSVKDVIAIVNKSGKFFAMLNCPKKKEMIVAIEIERPTKKIDEISNAFLKIFYNLMQDKKLTYDMSKGIQTLLESR